MPCEKAKFLSLSSDNGLSLRPSTFEAQTALLGAGSLEINRSGYRSLSIAVVDGKVLITLPDKASSWIGKKPSRSHERPDVQLVLARKLASRIQDAVHSLGYVPFPPDSRHLLAFVKAQSVTFPPSTSHTCIHSTCSEHKTEQQSCASTLRLCHALREMWGCFQAARDG